MAIPKATSSSDVSTESLFETVSLLSGPKGRAEPLAFSCASANVFVGPNHSGKSLLLQELRAAIHQPEQAPHRKVLKDISFVPFSEQRKATLTEELRAAMVASPNHPTSNVLLRRAHWSSEYGKEHFERLLSEASKIRDAGEHHYFRPYFLAGSDLILGGAERLEMLKPTTREAPRGKSRNEAYYVQVLSRLFYSDEKRRILQALIHDAFQFFFVIDPLDANFVAKISMVAPPVGVERSLGDGAVDFFSQATPIDRMSDGVRAFCGMLAAVIASDAKVILIDEPEAFLHPALCVKLARELCRLARDNGQQLFVSTHSASFLMGCVQAGIDLNIVRLTFQRGDATSRILSRDELVLTCND